MTMCSRLDFILSVQAALLLPSPCTCTGAHSLPLLGCVGRMHPDTTCRKSHYRLLIARYCDTAAFSGACLASGGEAN